MESAPLFCSNPLNRFPNCLSMEIEAKVIAPERRSWSAKILAHDAPTTHTHGDQVELYLNIRFGEESLNLLGGNVRFGLRYGELRFNLENGEVPLKAIELGSPFQVSLPIKLQKEEGSELQGGASISSASSLNVMTKGTRKTSREINYEEYQVKSSGSATEPAWIFEAKTVEPVLSGLLKQAKLCAVQVTAKPCRIQATFKISKRSIRLTGAEGLWPSDIDRNKLAILERKLALLLLERRLNSCLSELELIYE